MESRAGATIDVWVAEPDVAGLAQHERELDDVERSRAGVLPRQQASRFVLARVLLRRAVAATACIDPRDVTLVARCPTCGGDHGPVSVLAPEGAWVSITRSGPLVAVAVSDCPVGVDIDDVAAVTAAPLVDVALSSRERARHDRLPPRVRGQHLARTWVRKEAVLKALGTGLVTDPRTIELDGAGVREPAGVGVREPAAGGHDRLGEVRSGWLGVVGRPDLTVADLAVPLDHRAVPPDHRVVLPDRRGRDLVGAVATVTVPEPRQQRGAGGRAPRTSVSHPVRPVVRLHDGAGLLAAEAT